MIVWVVVDDGAAARGDHFRFCRCQYHHMHDASRAQTSQGASAITARALVGFLATWLDLRWAVAVLRCMGGHEFAHLRSHRFRV